MIENENFAMLKRIFDHNIRIPNRLEGLLSKSMDRPIKYAKLFLQHGANPNRRHSIPTKFAPDLSDPHCQDPFCQGSACIHPLPKEMIPSYNALEIALAFGTEEHVQLLLEWGADPFQTNIILAPTEQQIKNIEVVQKEQKKRLGILLLCAKEMHIDLPTSIAEEIRMAVQK